MQRRIPKRIIQFFVGKTPRQPLRTKAIVSNIRLHNPDFEYLFFDGSMVERFVADEFPQFRAVFDSFKFPAQRYDFFRYLAVYRYGGFYFDLDVLLASPLTPLLQHGCVFPFEAINLSHAMRDSLNMDWQVGNYAFGAAADHPFLEAVIKNCVRAQKDPSWVAPLMKGSPRLLKDEFYVVNSTGPLLVSRTLAEDPTLAGLVTVLFPDDVCDVNNWNRFGHYGLHLMDGSWRAERSFILRKLNNYYWLWIQNRRVRESRRRGPSRQHPGPVIVNDATVAPFESECRVGRRD